MDYALGIKTYKLQGRNDDFRPDGGMEVDE
jgi:hypothetical protein